MRDVCDAEMRRACAHACDAKCHVTRRDVTERKSVQDPSASSSIPDAVGAVDKAEVSTLGEALDVALGSVGALFDGSYDRMPVLNMERRTPADLNADVRGALLRRDGAKCWMCGLDRTTLAARGLDARLVIEHLRPRSSFPSGEVERADRTDNLRIACWSCNQAKSNRAVPYRPAQPIVWICSADVLDLFSDAGELVPAWCDNCQASTLAPDVPSVIVRLLEVA